MSRLTQNEKWGLFWVLAYVALIVAVVAYAVATHDHSCIGPDC